MFDSTQSPYYNVYIKNDRILITIMPPVYGMARRTVQNLLPDRILDNEKIILWNYPALNTGSSR